MPEFCKCGSIMINNKCTNKNCTLKASADPTAKKAAVSRKSGAPEKAVPKSSKTRRASKCITYNLYDKQEEEGG